MMKFELGNGHTITVEKANRGIEDDYKITFFEDGRKLFEEYANKDCIEWEYDVTIQDEEIEETETTPEGQRPDEDLLAYMERVDPELFASMKYLAGYDSISDPDPEQEEISEDVNSMIESPTDGIMNNCYQIARTLIPVFSAIFKKYLLAEDPENIRPPPEMIDSNRIKINLERRRLP